MDKTQETFEPRIVAFLCRWCSYAGADLAGVSRLIYPANIIPLRVNCSGRVDAEMVLGALEKGADACIGCSAPCASACPHGIPIPERTRAAHDLLTLA